MEKSLLEKEEQKIMKRYKIDNEPNFHAYEYRFNRIDGHFELIREYPNKWLVIFLDYRNQSKGIISRFENYHDSIRIMKDFVQFATYVSHSE